MDSEPKEWTVPGLERDPVTLKYKDDDLANILIKAIEEPAAAFQACGIPEAMRPIDCLGIVAARDTYNLCTLNEFRKFTGLREYQTFEEWNPDPEVAKAAEKLYIHPDNLELYVGLLAEGTKPPMLGSGLCPGRTISRAILSDAVSPYRIQIQPYFALYDLLNHRRLSTRVRSPWCVEIDSSPSTTTSLLSPTGALNTSPPIFKMAAKVVCLAR